MIFQFFRRTRDDPSIASLYGTIVAQARVKALYQRFGVPDTVNGRLEMILLHVVLLLRRLNDEPDGAPGDRLYSICSARTWTTTCAKWGWAIWRCRRRCGASARPSMGGRPPMSGHWRPAIPRHWSKC